MWNIIRADEFCESVRDGTHDTPKPVEDGFKLVTSKHILNGRVYPEDAYCISEKDFKKINERSKVDKWDVLMSMIGNGLGKSAIIDYTPDFAIKNIALFKIGNEAKAKWLHYFLSSNYAQNVILNYLQGTGQPFLSLNLIRGFKIWNPPNTILEKIVKILSCYDEAIENNNKRIKLLEQMAQNLYKEWFVRFRFPGYENCEFENGIPVGWNVERIGELYHTTSGGTPSRNHEEYYQEGTYPWIKTGELKDYPIIETEEYITEDAIIHSSAKVFEKDSLIIAMYGATIGHLGINKMPATCNQACCVLRPKENRAFGIYYLFNFFKGNRDFIIGLGNGAAQQNLSQILINRIKILNPPKEVLEPFEKMQSVFFEKIYFLQRANKNLAKQRDLLLPKLMSGKIEV